MYRVKLTPVAAQTFNKLHPDTKKQLKSKFKDLYKDPYLGKALQDDLIGFRSLKMKRYRAIYQINNQNKEAIIYAIGHRQNIYKTIKKLAGT